MFKAHSFVACLCVLQFSHFVNAFPAQQLNAPSSLQVKNVTALFSPAALRPFQVKAPSDHEVFRIPNSRLILDLQPRGGVSEASVGSILLTADSWVARKISIFSPDGPSDYIWEYGTGTEPNTRLIIWSLGDTLTWGQLKTIIDGLWLFLVDMINEEYTYWDIYNGEMVEESRIGCGTITDAKHFSGNSIIGPAPSNSSSTSGIQASPDIGLLTLNISQPVTAPIPFPIPSSDMTLEFERSGGRLSPPVVNALLLVAAIAADVDVENHGEYTPSAGAEFTYSLDQGVELWLLKTYNTPRGYLTYGNIRTMIAGLQLYIVLGRRPQAVTFRVLSGPNSKVLGHGAVGNLWPPDPTLNVTSEKDISNS